MEKRDPRENIKNIKEAILDYVYHTKEHVNYADIILRFNTEDTLIALSELKEEGLLYRDDSNPLRTRCFITEKGAEIVRKDDEERGKKSQMNSRRRFYEKI